MGCGSHIVQGPSVPNSYGNSCKGGLRKILCPWAGQPQNATIWRRACACDKTVVSKHRNVRGIFAQRDKVASFVLAVKSKV